jgi:predicted permease
MTNFIRDFKLAVRTIGRRPWHSFVCILIIAIGIGAGTTFFSAVSAIAFKPLPFPEPERLIFIGTQEPASGKGLFPLSLPNFADIRDQSTAFESISAIQAASFRISSPGAEPEACDGLNVSPSLGDVLKIPLHRGRWFTPEDADARVVVISHALWQRRFGGDNSIVGKTVFIEGAPHRVIGVTPPDFRGAVLSTDWWGGHGDQDLYLPIPKTRDMEHRGSQILRVIARLAPGFSMQAANAQLSEISKRLEAEHPETNAKKKALAVGIVEKQATYMLQRVLIFQGAALLLLLVAASNVGNLRLAVTAGRRGELAIRRALGASRPTLVGMLLVESLVLSAMGGGLGVLLSLWGVEFLRSGMLSDVDHLFGLDIDTGALMFSVCAVFVTAALAGMGPALRWTRAGILSGVQEAAGRTSTDLRQSRLRTALVVVEVGLSVVLLIGAGLFARSLIRLSEHPLGFEPSGLLTAQMSVNATYSFSESEKNKEAFATLTARLSRVPSIARVDLADTLPLQGHFASGRFQIVGRDPWPVNEGPTVAWRVITPGYLGTMGIRVIAGRGFAETDTTGGKPVALIPEETARLLFPRENPVGAHLKHICGDVDNSREIVGVISDSLHYPFGSPGNPMVYVPFEQCPFPYMKIVVKPRSLEPDFAALEREIRAAVHEVDPEQPVSGFTRMEKIVRNSSYDARSTAKLAGALALTAVLLAALGLYAVIAQSVTYRRREFGIRIALGARPRDLRRLVLGEGLKLIGVGIAIGLLVSAGLSRFIASRLFETSHLDVPTYLAAAVVLTIVGLIACELPLRRALKASPGTAIRSA